MKKDTTGRLIAVQVCVVFPETLHRTEFIELFY